MGAVYLGFCFDELLNGYWHHKRPRRQNGCIKFNIALGAAVQASYHGQITAQLGKDFFSPEDSKPKHHSIT